MRLNNPFCPVCGLPARGTVQRLYGRADFDVPPESPESEVEYSGHTEIDRDGQATVTECDPNRLRRPGEAPRTLVVCANLHEWPTEIS